MHSGKEGDAACLLRSSDSALVLIDFQERLAPSINDVEAVTAKVIKLIAAARRLDVPVFATEHCPDAIGPTLPRLREELGESEIFVKTHFNICEEAAFREAVGQFRPKQWVLCGLESHVCVLQAALGLRQMGECVFPVSDATGSRVALNKYAALDRLRAAGCVPVTTEMVLFEWLHHAGHPAFKDILHLIK